MFGSGLRYLVVFSMMAVATQASPALTQIQDVLFKADGSPFNGLVQIDWKSFVAGDGTVVPANTMSLNVSQGYLSVALVPTTNAQKAAYYTVRLYSNGQTQSTEYWIVPPTPAILKLQQIRTSTAPVGNLSSSVVVNIQDVVGLRTELDLRPTRGAGWMTNRVAAIGASGGIEAVTGAAADCIHVDGTSGPCGSASGGSGSAVTYVDSDTPAGTKNGVNASFTLSSTPSPLSSLRLFRNGLLQVQNTDFTISGNTIVMASGSIPKSTEIMQAWYRTSGALATLVDGETPAGTLNGVNAVFTVAAAPSPSTSLQLYRNGVLLKSGVDFTLSGSQITFIPAAVPKAGDIVQASYRK